MTPKAKLLDRDAEDSPPILKPLPPRKPWGVIYGETSFESLTSRGSDTPKTHAESQPPVTKAPSGYRFDLLAEVEDYEAPDDPKEISFRKFPVAILANFDRGIAGSSKSQQDAFVCCLQHAFEEFATNRDKYLWCRLNELLTKCPFADSDGWTSYVQLKETWSFEIPSFTAGTKQRRFDVDPELKRKVSSTASDLGLSMSDLCLVLVMQSLVDVDGVALKKEMQEVVERFYRKLRIRLRSLVATLKVYQVEVGEDVDKIIREVAL